MSIVRVANIIEEGRYGGPQARIVAVARHLRTQRLETTVVFPRAESTVFRERLLAAGVAHVPFPLHQVARNPVALSKFAATFSFDVLKLARFFRRHRYDLVHCNSSWQYKGLFAAKLAGCKVIWHLNDTNAPQAARALFRRLSPLADGFIVASENVRRYYFGDAPIRKPLLQIQAPVDTSHFDPENAEPDSQVSNLPRAKVVTVCNVNPAKGLETFIDMAAIIEKRGQPASFAIVGPIYQSQAAYAERLRRRAARLNVTHLHFLGPRDDVRGVLKATDIYVCSSRYEASPTSLWEAMAMGLPVVSTDVGDVRPFFADARCGIVVPVEEPEALADEVLRLMDRSEERRERGERARKFAVAQLDLDQCVKRHADIYAQVLDASSRTTRQPAVRLGEVFPSESQHQ